MSSLFNALKKQAADTLPETFLRLLEEKGIQQVEEYFFFQTMYNQTAFEQALAYLSSDITLTAEALSGYTIVARTVDGDFIAADSQTVLVIPRTLVTADVEQHPLSVFDFFIAWEDGSLHSQLVS